MFDVRCSMLEVGRWKLEVGRWLLEAALSFELLGLPLLLPRPLRKSDWPSPRPPRSTFRCATELRSSSHWSRSRPQKPASYPNRTDTGPHKPPPGFASARRRRAV